MIKEKRDTNVPHSHAGYYKQTLVAVKKLSELINEDDEVGIECGADVRIFRLTGENSSIEVKFYKDNMTKNSEAITKTIYNFYRNSRNDENLTFNTNVSLKNDDDKEFFSKWSNSAEFTEEIIYVKSCISMYEKIDESFDFDAFVKKIKFDFEDISKEGSIENIKGDIKRNLIERYPMLKDTGDETLDLKLDIIINCLCDEFYMSSVHNSSENIEKMNYEKWKKIKVSDLISTLNNYSQYEIQYKENVVIKKICSIYFYKKTQDEVEEYVKYKLKRYEELKLVFNRIMEEGALLQYSKMNFTEALKSAGIKGIDDTDFENMAYIFQEFYKGFGILALLIGDECIETIYITSKKVTGRMQNNEQFSFDNEGYYDYDRIFEYIKSMRPVDSSKTSNIYLLRGSNVQIFNSPNDYFINIQQPTSILNLDEYCKNRGLFEKFAQVIRSFIRLSNNILIIGPREKSKRLLLGALIKELDSDCSCLYDDFSMKFTDKNLNVDEKSVDSYNIDDILYQLDHISRSRSNRIIVNVGNYCTLFDGVFYKILNMTSQKKGYIVCFNDLLRNYDNDINKRFEEINKQYAALHQGNLCFDGIDYVILIDYSKNNNDKISGVWEKGQNTTWVRLFSNG